jgi:hypothetical protein
MRRVSTSEVALGFINLITITEKNPTMNVPSNHDKYDKMCITLCCEWLPAW